MGAKKGAKVRIVKKNDDYSQDYQVGDVFTVEGTWYGGIHVTTPSGCLYPWTRRNMSWRTWKWDGRWTGTPMSWE